MLQPRMDWNMMQLWRAVRKLPQPVKGLFVLYMVVFAVAFLSVPLAAFTGQAQSAEVVPWTFGAVGVAAVLLGLALVFDVRGSAQAYAGMVKDFKPMGVDYSNSFFARPAYIRAFGGLFAVIGIVFIVAATVYAGRNG